MVIRIEVAGEAENFIQLQLSDIGVNISQETAKRILNGLKIDVKNFNVDRFIASIRDRVNGYIQRYGSCDNLVEEKKEILSIIMRFKELKKSRLTDNKDIETRKSFFKDLRLLLGLSTDKKLAQKIFGDNEGACIKYANIKSGYLSISEKIQEKVQLLLEEALLK